MWLTACGQFFMLVVSFSFVCLGGGAGGDWWWAFLQLLAEFSTASGLGHGAQNQALPAISCDSMKKMNLRVGLPIRGGPALAGQAGSLASNSS